METTQQFDPVKYKNTTRDQWQTAAEAWFRWSPTLNQWLGKATETMLNMAGISSGQRVLDVAAGAGEQSITTAKKVGAKGYVLATDISSNILEFAQQMAKQEGLKNIETQVMDGENLTIPDSTFDAVISRVGLIYFPDQQRALKEMFRVLKSGEKLLQSFIQHLTRINSFQFLLLLFGIVQNFLHQCPVSLAPLV